MKLSRGLMRLQATGNIGGAKAKLEQTLKADAVQAGTDAPCHLPGIVLQRPGGPLRVIESYKSVWDCHGSWSLGSMLKSSSEVYACLALDAEFENVDFAKALFLDTETTGLAGGAGTLPFLTGIARFEGEQLIVEQLLVENYGLEVPSLEYLRHRLNDASCVVTFNGKSFDWPLLRARYVMNRLEPPEPPPHYDLLHVARRVLKRRLSSVRLTALEKHLLHFERVGDVDGGDIPSIYFDFLQTGRVDELQNVIRHNEWDMYAMPAIMGWLAAQFVGPHAEIHPADLVGFGHVAERYGDHDRALKIFNAASARTGFRKHAAEAHLALASYAHADADYAREVYLLENVLVLDDGCFRERAYHRLAITLEHKLKDFGKALIYARQCAAVEGFHAAQHRCRRLEQKCLRKGGLQQLNGSSGHE